MVDKLESGGTVCFVSQGLMKTEIWHNWAMNIRQFNTPPCKEPGKISHRAQSLGMITTLLQCRFQPEIPDDWVIILAYAIIDWVRFLWLWNNVYSRDLFSHETNRSSWPKKWGIATNPKTSNQFKSIIRDVRSGILNMPWRKGGMKCCTYSCIYIWLYLIVQIFAPFGGRFGHLLEVF